GASAARDRAVAARGRAAAPDRPRALERPSEPVRGSGGGGGRGGGGLVRVHAPEAVVAVVIVLGAGPRRGLAVGTGLDVATEGQDQPLGGGRDLGNGGVEGFGVPG